MNKKSSVIFLAESGVIAALYAVLTYVASMMNLAYGPVQFRFSELLTVLPIFTPSAVPGLAIGCLIANLGSPLGVVDWVFGSLATLLAAIATRMLRDIKFKDIPFFALFPPVIFNALIIGLEIACISDAGVFSFGNLSLPVFLSAALSVGIGQLVICVILGVPFVMFLKKINLNKLIRTS